MLQLRDKIGTFDDFTFYSDFDEPEQFLYIPQKINISKDDQGKPIFTLIQFASDNSENDGGYLKFQVDMAVDATKREIAFRKYLNSINYDGPTPNLAAVPYDEGTVNFVVLEKVENSLGKMVNTQSPSLIGDNTAIFNALLTPIESQICEALFLDAAAPAAVYYNLTYTGIVPALNIRVEAKFESIYNELDVKFGASVISLDPPLNFYLGFNAVIKDLIERGDLKIDIVERDKDPARHEKDKEWVLDFVKVEILKSFFKASIDVNDINKDQAIPSSESLLSSLFDMLKKEEEKKKKEGGDKALAAGEGGGGALPIPALSLQVQMVSITEAKSFNLNFNIARSEQRTISPLIFIGAEVSKLPPEEPFFLRKKLNSPFFQKINMEVFSPSVFDKLGLQAARAEITYEGSKYTPPSFTAPSDTPWTKEISRADNIDTPLSIVKTFNYDSEASSGIVGKTEINYAVDSLSNTVSLQPDNYIQTKEVQILGLLLDFDLTPLVQVKIQYTEPEASEKEVVFTFKDGDSLDQSFKYRYLIEEPWALTYELLYFFADGRQEVFKNPAKVPVTGILIPRTPPQSEDYASL